MLVWGGQLILLNLNSEVQKMILKLSLFNPPHRVIFQNAGSQLKLTGEAEGLFVEAGDLPLPPITPALSAPSLSLEMSQR